MDRFLIERLENAALKLHEPQLAPPMTEPADHLEYGTVIKDGELYRLYTRDGRGAHHDGDLPEVFGLSCGQELPDEVAEQILEERARNLESQWCRVVVKPR